MSHVDLKLTTTLMEKEAASIAETKCVYNYQRPTSDGLFPLAMSCLQKIPKPFQIALSYVK